jgi:hypothetical protein
LRIASRRVGRSLGMGTYRPGGEKEHVIVLTENCTVEECILNEEVLSWYIRDTQYFPVSPQI